MYLCFWGKTAFHRPDKDKLKWSCTTPNNKKIIQNQNTSMAILFFLNILSNFIMLGEKVEYKFNRNEYFLVLPPSFPGIAHKSNDKY